MIDRRRARRLRWASVVAVLASLWASAGRADVPPSLVGSAADPTAADEFIARGVALRREGRDAEALPLFEAAYVQARTPRAAAQLGFVEQALGRWVNAESHLFEAITANTDPWIRRNADLIEESLTLVHKHVGLLQVDVSVARAEIFVDGRSVGRAPLSAAIGVATGDRRVEVRADGYRPLSTTAAVSAGETAKVIARLQPVSLGQDPADLALGARSAPATGAGDLAWRGGTDATGSGADATSRPIYKRWWFWTGAAVVLAGTALAIALSSGPAPYPCGGAGRVCAR